MTDAERIAEALGADGSVWEDASGRHLTDLLEDAGAVRERDDARDATRYTLPDDSVIVVGGNGWDLGFEDCWCMETSGHDPITCERLRQPCAYCGAEPSVETPGYVWSEVPAESDTEAWDAMALMHEEGCEWVLTRACRRDAIHDTIRRERHARGMTQADAARVLGLSCGNALALIERGERGASGPLRALVQAWVAGRLDDVSDHQINDLRREAGEAGDIDMVCICLRALGVLDNYIPGDEGEVEQAKSRALQMSRVEARAECARVIADAAAQE